MNVLHHAPAFWSGFVRGVPVAVAITRCDVVRPVDRFLADPRAFVVASGPRCVACDRTLGGRADRAGTLRVHILWPEGAP